MPTLVLMGSVIWPFASNLSAHLELLFKRSYDINLRVTTVNCKQIFGVSSSFSIAKVYLVFVIFIGITQEDF